MTECCAVVNVSLCFLAEEVAKLEKHLMLLRQEYVKLQKKLAETEKRCTLLAAQANKESSSESFISRLLTIVADLYEQEQYRCALAAGLVRGSKPFCFIPRPPCNVSSFTDFFPKFIFLILRSI